MKKLLISLLVLASLFMIVSCKDEPVTPPQEFNVSFDLNGHGLNYYF